MPESKDETHLFSVNDCVRMSGSVRGKEKKSSESREFIKGKILLVNTWLQIDLCACVMPGKTTIKSSNKT